MSVLSVMEVVYGLSIDTDLGVVNSINYKMDFRRHHSMTLNDVKRRNSLIFAFFFTEFDSFTGQLRYSDSR